MVNKSKTTSLDLQLIEALPTAVVVFDKTRVLFSNTRANKLFNYKKHNTEPGTLKVFFKNLTKTNYNKLLHLTVKHKSAHQTSVLIKNGKADETLLVHYNGVYYQNKWVIQAVFIKSYEDKPDQINRLELLEKIGNNQSDIIFELKFSPKTQVQYISKSVLKILGYKPSEIYQNNALLKSRILKEDLGRFIFSKSDFSKKTNSSLEQNSLLRFRHKNGNLKYLDYSGKLIYDDSNNVTGLYGSFRNVTEVKETEQLLIETKKKFDLITNNGHEAITFYTYLPEDKYHYVSPNIKTILGCEATELLADNFFLKKRIVEGHVDFEKTDKLLKRSQKNNVVKNHTNYCKVRKKSGEDIWIENTFIPIVNTHGKISFFMNIIRDVSAQKEKEIQIELQHSNYSNLLDHSPVAYIIHDQGVCVYVNNAMMSMLKFKNKNQILGKFAIDLIVPEQRKRATKRIAQIYSRKAETKKFVNYTLTDADNHEIDVEIKSVLIKFNNKDCILSLLNNLSEKQLREKEKQKVTSVEAANSLLQKEIKERKEAERNLTEITAHLTSIFESSTHILWTVDADYRVTSFNKNFANSLKSERGVDIKIGNRVDELLKTNRNEYCEFWYTHYAEAFRGIKLEFEHDDFKEGKIYRKVFINPIYNKQNKVTELSCIANDITDSKIYEQKLLSQTGKLTAIFDSSHHYIWTINRQEKLTSFNKNYYDLVTALYNTKPYVGLILDRGVLSNDKEYTTLLKYHYNKAFNGVATSFEIETRDQELKNIYLEIFLNPIYENDNVVEVSGIAHNITEKKIVQQRMEVSLKEKEILLREVHHRVKNNMQVISSILNLQSSYVSDEYTLNLLKESQNRIKTMAYIHESLYQNKSFTSVNFSDYVQTLVNNIVQSYSYSGDKIELELNIQNITLSLDSSIPAGLIINELTTNAIKHAFPGTRKGRIIFNLRCENNLVILELKDDGVGFAQGIDFENSHSLGLQLVNTLTEQIDGVIKFKSETNKGTEVTVTFNM